VINQHLIAGRGQFRPILLKTAQDNQISLIDDGNAEALYIRRTSLTLLLRTSALLRDRENREGKNKGERK
jgi:hypothetical protein